MPLRADAITKDYVKDAGVFADIFNYYISSRGHPFRKAKRPPYPVRPQKGGEQICRRDDTANGIIQGIRPLLGYNYGAGEYGRVRRIYRTALAMNMGIMLAGTVVSWLMPFLPSRTGMGRST